MPSASANISAKFIAQIEIGMTRVPRYSDPAAASRPIIVSISGRPAATSEPKASSMMPSVTGQEMTSDLSIAERLAALKSDHMPGAPVRLTTTAPLDRPCSVPFSAVGGGHHLVRVARGAALHDRGVAVGGDRQPGRRRDHGAHGGIGAQRLLDAASQPTGMRGC